MLAEASPILGGGISRPSSSGNIEAQMDNSEASEGDPGNTMYEFLDGLRYTYYCF